METPRPTQAHRKLDRILGKWRGEETMPPSQWSPEGCTAIGRCEGRLALGGFAAIVDYEQQSAGSVTFRGHGVYTYDPEDACYILHWFDSMGGSVEVFRGSFDGDMLTMARSGPQGHVRLTWEYSGEQRMTTRMEMSPDGEQWRTMMEGAYVREA